MCHSCIIMLIDWLIYFQTTSKMWRTCRWTSYSRMPKYISTRGDRVSCPCIQCKHALVHPTTLRSHGSRKRCRPAELEVGSFFFGIIIIIISDSSISGSKPKPNGKHGTRPFGQLEQCKLRSRVVRFRFLGVDVVIGIIGSRSISCCLRHRGWNNL